MVLLFWDNLLPVFLAAGAGYALAAVFDTDPRPVSRLAFYVFAPCFVFDIIVDGRVAGTALVRMVAFTAAGLLALAAIAWLAARALGWSRTLCSAVALVVLLPNAGNFGLSANRFAFGEDGLAQAGVFFLTSSVLTFTVGVLVASLGRSGLGAALAALPRVPTVWSVVLAVVVVHTGRGLPLPLDRTVDLFAAACIPVFLVVLGMQLHGKGIRGPLGPVALAAGFRLLGGAVAGMVLAPAFGLDGVARQTGILQSAMPSAVICIVLATEYEVEPAFVTSVVFTTTLLSPVTLTPLLAWLGA